MNKSFDDTKVITEVEINAIWDGPVSEIGWIQQQMLLAEGIVLEANSNVSGDDFRSLFPIAGFGSELWLKRQILPVFCLAYQDIKEVICDKQYDPGRDDPDKYVHLIIPPRHRKFFRLANELQKLLPWIGYILDPRDESSAITILERIKHLGLRAKVLIRYRDLNEERTVD